MSRIGKQVIVFDNSINVTLTEGGVYGGQNIQVTGPKGTLSLDVRPGVKVVVDNDTKTISLEKNGDDKQAGAFHGLYRSLIANMVIGVKDGYSKKLEIHGVGYRAKLSGNVLELTVGFNHPIKFTAPEGIKFEVEKEELVIISGVDKQLVGDTAAKIREIRKPEPYKGKGIRYEGEYVRRKVGKAMSK